jgi:hypothetical protein
MFKKIPFCVLFLIVFLIASCSSSDPGEAVGVELDSEVDVKPEVPGETSYYYIDGNAASLLSEIPTASGDLNVAYEDGVIYPNSISAMVIKDSNNKSYEVQDNIAPTITYGPMPNGAIDIGSSKLTLTHVKEGGSWKNAVMDKSTCETAGLTEMTMPAVATHTAAWESGQFIQTSGYAGVTGYAYNNSGASLEPYVYLVADLEEGNLFWKIKASTQKSIKFSILYIKTCEDGKSYGIETPSVTESMIQPSYNGIRTVSLASLTDEAKISLLDDGDGYKAYMVVTEISGVAISGDNRYILAAREMPNRQ